METILSATNLKFEDLIEYPEINISFAKTTFICGESGCGKSTLLKLLNSTVTPSRGTIFYCGDNTNSINTIALRREVLLISQSVYLFDGSIKENFEQYYLFRDEKMISEEEMKKFLQISCADFSLDTKCETMSGGERQRVFIAICLSFKPKVLMLDEPTSALDSTTSNRFFIQLKDFCKDNNITIIVVCHDENLVNSYADVVITLEKKVTL